MVVMLILDEIYANIYDFEVDPIKEYLKKMLLENIMDMTLLSREEVKKL